MGIIYDRLWETMAKKGITEYRLQKDYGFSPSLFTRIRKGMNISTATIANLCDALDCDVEDVIHYKKENPKR